MKFAPGTLILALLLVWGCVAGPAGVSIESRAPADTTEAAAAFVPQRAWVFVEGVQKGTTPATLRIRRSFEVTHFSLHVGPEFEEVRRYEIERSDTYNRTMLDYTFSGTSDGGVRTFNHTELGQDRRGRFIIPYFEYPVQIVDHEYDLVVIVSE